MLIPDREQLSSLVEQKLEIHLQHIEPRALGNRLQSLDLLGRRVRLPGKLVTSLLEREQMSGEVAAGDSRDVRRLEHSEIAEVVPVVEVAAVPTHSLQ